jgi:hypothetical protein
MEIPPTGFVGSYEVVYVPFLTPVAVTFDPDLVVALLSAEVVFDPDFVSVADAEDSLSEFVDVTDAVALAFGAVVAVADAESL